MRNFKFLFILMMCATAHAVVAQQDPNFTLYNFNMNVINPAFAGTNGFKEISLGHRSQWIGVENGPNTQIANFTSPLRNNLGIGVSLVRNKVFVLQESDVTVDISYKLKLSYEHDLYFGVKTGASFININLSSILSSGSDPLFTENRSYSNTQFGAGFYLKHEKYYVSISSPNILKGKRYIKNGNAPNAVVDNLHMYYGMGYRFDLTDRVSISPGIMYRSTKGATSSTDINATLSVKNVQVGANYRVDDMYSIFTVFNIIDNVKFGAAYDISANELNDFNKNGSMEVLIKYQF